MTELTDTERETLADRIRREALIADRPGQLGRLEQIADEVSDIVFRLARVEALADEWEKTPRPTGPEDAIGAGLWVSGRDHARDLRAALAAPTPTEVQP
jgi:hypothetical protein